MDTVFSIFSDSIIFTALLWVIVGVLVITVALSILRSILRKKHIATSALGKKILQLKIPKEGAKGEEEEKGGRGEYQEIVAVAESLYLSLGSIRPRSAFRSYFYGREDEISFEIVAIDGHIKFFAVVPDYLQTFFEQQFLAQYPSAQIEETTDYNVFLPRGGTAAAAVTLNKHWIFPIRTYRKMDSDPLNALTNALSKTPPGQGVVLQIMIRTASSGWRSKGQKFAREMQHGKTVKEAMRAAKLGSGVDQAWGAFASASATTAGVLSNSKDKAPKQEHRMSPLEQELVKAVEEKGSKAGFEVNIRVIGSAQTSDLAQMHVYNVVNAFAQYAGPESGVALVKAKRGAKSQIIQQSIYRQFDDGKDFVLNAEELASLFHMPLSTTETPNIDWLTSRNAPPPVNMPSEGILLGENRFRGVTTEVRMTRPDRQRHTYIIGMTGSGKTTLMKNMIKQDIANGEGCCFVDPHGDAIQDILESIPANRADDVVLFEPADVSRPMGLNMLEARNEELKDFAVQEMIAIFYKLFPPEMIGPMFEHNMRNVMLTLMSDLHNPGTIAEIPRMFSDADFQKSWVAKVKDPVVRAFWEKEMAKTSDFHKSEMLGYLISKVGRFVENTMMRNIIGQSHSGFDVRDIMDNKKILLVNLSKGQVGEVNSNLLGLIIVSKLQMAAMSRVDIPEKDRSDFYLYIDEFQNFITDSISTILAEARKYRLNLIMGHQYIAQLSPKAGDTGVRDAVFGNVGTVVSFRVGVDDAELIAKQMAPVFNEYDVMNIERTHAYIRLLINGTAARPFNMRTYAPAPGDAKIADAIRQLSRLKYGRDRSIVEQEIMSRTQLGTAMAAAAETGVEQSK